MKTAAVLFFSMLVIITGRLSHKAECGIRSAAQAVPPRIWFEQASDPNIQNPVITRFLHNKAGIFLNEMSKCYFKSTSPGFIRETSTILGLISTAYLIYNLMMKTRLAILTAIFMVTLLPALSINSPSHDAAINLLATIYKILAISGFLIYLKQT